VPGEPTPTTARRTSHARVRLLEIADELFYSDGINSVGIDRIIADAGVTKATFYKQYGSKDALILEYITGRDSQIRAALEELAAASPDPASVLAALIDAVVADTARPGFRGDPFINAAAQFADENHPVRLAVTAHRDWYAHRIEDLFREIGHPRPGDAADDLILARDGALAGGYVGDPIAAGAALHRSLDRILAEA
jgi:AcrR family transcriptional regulator